MKDEDGLAMTGLFLFRGMISVMEPEDQQEIEKLAMEIRRMIYQGGGII